MGDFEVIRNATIAAPRERVHALIDDFHEWRKWSPWEDMDPDLRRDYGGPDAGPGASYAWEGNRKAGKGSMEITGSSPERVDVRLAFEKPWKATNHVSFELADTGEARTGVTWRMTGTTTGLLAIFGKLFSMDRMVGKDFEKGLARLKAVSEQSG
jgi:polyketide cyclase/dehydrase/lipid transport protein